MGQGSIQGAVLDHEGRAVAGAAVMLAGTSPDHPDIAALTADDGSFSFLDLDPGRYEVLVRAGDRSPETRSVEVGEAGPARVEFRLT